MERALTTSSNLIEMSMLGGDGARIQNAFQSLVEILSRGAPVSWQTEKITALRTRPKSPTK